MLSLMWRMKSKDSSPERSIVFENKSYSSNEEKMKWEDGLSCDHYQQSHNFLDSCHLCHKPLSGKDVYMYRGEMGFCSEGCRSRQMYLEDMKKIEISTRRILASFHDRRRRPCQPTKGGAAHYHLQLHNF